MQRYIVMFNIGKPFIITANDEHDAHQIARRRWPHRLITNIVQQHYPPINKTQNRLLTVIDSLIEAKIHAIILYLIGCILIALREHDWKIGCALVAIGGAVFFIYD